MNWDQMKKNVGKLVELHPKAIFLDALGHENPSPSDDWQITGATSYQITLKNCRANHQTVLAKDHIHNYVSNPIRSPEHGILNLMVQLYIQGEAISISPCPRPGERVPPPPVAEIQDKCVDLMYPLDSIVKRLGVSHNVLGWMQESKVPTSLMNGTHELALERDSTGCLFRLCVRTSPESLILVRRLG